MTYQPIAPPHPRRPHRQTALARAFGLLAGLFLLTEGSAQAAARTWVFLSEATDQRISTYEQDPTTGQLTLLSQTAVGAEPGFLVANRNATRLYAAYRSSGELASFRIHAPDGRLERLSQIPAGADPAYVALDQSEQFLLSAYYVAGKIGSHPISPDGHLQADTAQWYTTNKKAHAIRTDRHNQWALVPHTGPNAVYVFAFNPADGSLLPGAPPLTYTGTLTGPRHLWYHPTLDQVYFDNEQGSSVSVYTLDHKVGQLQHLQTLTTLPDSHTGPNSCADMEMTPDGKFLYAANRGHDSLAAYAVDEKSGKLTPVGIYPTEKTPRAFTISPDGRWLTAAGQSSNHLQTYAIEPTTGVLTPVERLPVGPRPWAILAVQAPR